MVLVKSGGRGKLAWSWAGSFLDAAGATAHSQPEPTGELRRFSSLLPGPDGTRTARFEFGEPGIMLGSYLAVAQLSVPKWHLGNGTSTVKPA